MVTTLPLRRSLLLALAASALVPRAASAELPPGVGDDGQTLVDTAAAESAITTATLESSAGPIEITYAASDAGGSGVERVELWVAPPGSIVYAPAATDADPQTPAFSYGSAAGDGDYRFYTLAVDRAGNREPAPASPDATVTRSSPTPSPIPTPAPDSTQQDTAVPPPPPTTTDAPLVQLPAQPATTQQSSSAPASLPLVAALTLPAGQRLGQVLRRGVRIRLFAYRPVEVRVTMRLPRRQARRFGLVRDPVVARRVFRATTPRVYELRLRIPGRVAVRLRRARSLPVVLRTALVTAVATSSDENRIRFRR